MKIYLDLVVLLNFLVDYALLLGSNRLTGYPPGWRPCFWAAAFGGGYAGACMLPGFRFLGNILWRMISLAVMAGIAFGWNTGAIPRMTLFVLLSMALGGAATAMGNGSFPSVLLAAAVVAGMCVLGFHTPPGSRRFVPAELTYGGKTIRLTALADTGNTLKDPVTGRQVLVAGADIAQALGFSRQQLLDPVGTLTQQPLPGLRLIPYRAVGQPGGMLLAMGFDEVKLNGKQASPVVAFAPENIGGTEAYQALAGGMI